MFFSNYLAGPESLLRKSSNLGANARKDDFFGGDDGDAIEAHVWKCVRAINGTSNSAFLCQEFDILT